MSRENIHPDLIKFYDELDAIFKLAEPIFQQKELLQKIRDRVDILKYEASEFIKCHPEMCDSCCPESDYCTQQVNGKCPKIKDDYSGLYYGQKSIYQLNEVVGNCGPCYYNRYADMKKREAEAKKFQDILKRKDRQS